MRYRYPKMANYLTVERSGGNMCIVSNYMDDSKYSMTDREFGFLRYLDGSRSPYSYDRMSRDEIRSLMRAFESGKLVRYDNRLTSMLLYSLRTVYVPKRTRSVSVIPKVLNQLLLLTFLPVLLLGMYLCMSGHTASSHAWIGLIAGLIIGCLMHEIAHAVACLAFGGRFFEAGIMTGVLPGAYVLIDETCIRSRMKRIQVLAAGVEMNLLICGLSMMLASLSFPGNGVFFWIALENLLMGVLNLSAAGGMDGAKIMKEILGLSCLEAIDLIIGDLRNLRMRRGPLNGSAARSVSYMLLGMQVSIPILILIEILSIVSLVWEVF